MCNMNTQAEIIPFKLDINPQLEAKMLYYAGWTISDISKKMNIPRSTVTFWRDNGGWDASSPFERCQATTELKYQHLVIKENKSNNDYKEIDCLAKLLKDIYFPKTEGAVKNKRSAQINKAEFDFDKFKTQFAEYYNDTLYSFQSTTMRQIEEASLSPQSSGDNMILKGRQQGFTFALSLTRFKRAIELKHNQIFISASKNQAFQARSYITKSVKECTGIELKGREKITVGQGIELYFLGCNASTAQGYSGDVTLDEFFWMPNFSEISKVVSACSTLAQYNTIYSSTPSTKTHQAYETWAATKWNKQNKKNKVAIDHTSLKNGGLCVDGKFRKIITLDDALDGGLLNVSKEKLLLKYDKESFNQLFMCEFLEIADSAFDFDSIEKCMVDIYDEWPDYKPFESPHRPLGNAPVAIGYDPARSNDGSAIVVIAIPLTPKDKYRILEKHVLHGIDFEAQAKLIKTLCEMYNVAHIGIDASGLGVAVYERVAKFYQKSTKYISTPELKSLFVLKAKDMFNKKKIEFDRGWSDVMQSFIAIKKVLTKSQRAMTYASDRTEENSHSDVAWAIMYALGVEGFDGETKALKKDSVLTF